MGLTPGKESEYQMNETSHNYEIKVNDLRISLAELTAMDKNEIKTIDACNCTALTAIDAPSATHIGAFECTALTTINAPAATHIYANKCTALIAINAPSAMRINVSVSRALTARSTGAPFGWLPT